MMGRSHALSGAAVWLAGSWVADQFFDKHQSPLYLALGTAVCAGGALLPDLDLSGKVTTGQGGATVAHTFGRVSMFVAEVVEKLSVGICTQFGKWAVLSILFFTIGLAVRGVFEQWAKKAGWVITTLVSAAAAYYAFLNLDAGRGYPLLGFALGIGCFVHLMGDIITSAGVPILWPIPTGIKKIQMWRMIGVPNAISVEVGGKVEKFVLQGAFTIVSIASGMALVGNALLRKFDIEL
jgi:hypothetical protein